MNLITNDAIMQHFGYPGAVNDKVRAFFNALYTGSGSPEGVITAATGAFYLDTTNGALYAKQTGSGNTGWIAGIAPGSGSGPYASVTEVVYAGGNSGAAVTLSLANGTIQTFTVSASCTFTMPTATAGKSFVVDLTNGGAFTATFTGVKWTGGTAPTLTSGVGKRDLFSLICSDGATWVGTALQDVR